MHYLIRSAGILLAAAVLSAQASPEPSAFPLSPLCENAFTHAVSLLPDSSADEGSAAGPSPTAVADLTHLDFVVQRCPSLAEWLGGMARYPELLGGADALGFLEARCTDPDSGLGRYAACVSLVQALATPRPTLPPTPAPDASAQASAAPLDLFDGPPPTPTRAAPTSGKAHVPDGQVPVPGAISVHHFHVRGETHDELMRSAYRQARRFCARRGVIACVLPRDWRFTTQTIQDPETGACTISDVEASVGYVAHIPRWTAPSRVPAPLGWWWQQVVIREGWRQTQHVHILEDHLAQLPDQVVGQPCSAFDRILADWNASLEQAQAEFARRDDPLRERDLATWLRKAGGG